MKRHKIYILIFILYFLQQKTIYSAHKKIEIAFFVTRTVNDMFYGPVSKFMQEAVNDLGMKLKVYGCEGNHIKLIQKSKSLLESSNKPDVLVVINLKNQATKVIKMAEKAKIPVFIVNAGINDPSMGKPREKYKYWIGEMLPDDQSAGYKIGEILVTKAKKNKGGKITIAAIKGHPKTGASREREKGLFNYIHESKTNVVIKRIVPAFWDMKIAERKFLLIKKTYPKIKVFWSASDGMALGIVNGCQRLGLEPGKDIYTAGIDWTTKGLKAVQKGQIEASIGGHFMEGAWVAILLYDYFHGKDFSSEAVEFRSEMSAITKKNINRYSKLLKEQNWKKINFRKFSKKLNPSLKKYKFKISEVLRQIE